MTPRRGTAGQFDLFRVPLKHPLAFAVALSPAAVSMLIGCWIFRPTGAMLLALVIAGFFCLHVVGDFFSGTVTANSDTATRRDDPLCFWTMWTVWVLAYLFAASFPILFAMQGRDTESSPTSAREAAAWPGLPHSGGGEGCVHHFGV